MDTSNCKNSMNSKYNNVVDHVYCHSNENYIRTNAGSLDVMAILKENKQLKAMLLLHLDLIQEQSDQLLAKDKLLANLKDENESLKTQIVKFERNYSSGNIKNSTTKTNSKNSNLQQVKKLIEEKKENLRDFTNVDKQQQTKSIINNKKTITSTCDDKINKICTTPTTATISTRSRQTPSPIEGSPQQQSPIENKYKIYDENSANCSSIIGQSNGKLISKIILHRVQIPESMIIPKKEHEQNNKATVSSELNESQQIQTISSDFKPKSEQKSLKSPRQTDSTVNINSLINKTELSQISDKVEIKTILQNNQIEIKSENIETSSKSFEINPKPQQDLLDQKNKSSLNQSIQIVGDNKRKCFLLTTSKCYAAREWIDEDIPPEEWSNKEEEEALKADAPMLEIPKWTIKEFSGLYSIEGTEDLTDDTFSKRHAKLEYDEKRRKKWDAQRIREQRTIERLKRRHCKDELQEIDSQELSSFYSTPDAIKFIQITEELPVLAFGECIPKLNSGEFHLPWMQRNFQQHNDMLISMAGGSGSSCGNPSVNNVNQNSSFMFLKKRRRQQSVTVNNSRTKSILRANATLTAGNSLGTESNSGGNCENFTSTG